MGALRGLAARAGLDERSWVFMVGLLLLARWAMDAAAIVTAPGFLHPDEHFQTVELALRALGRSGADATPWEVEARIRPWLQPGLYVLLARALRLEDPFALAAACRALSALLTALGTVALVAALPRWVPSLPTRRWALAFFLLAPWAPTLAVRTSSETLATAALLVTLSAFTLWGGDETSGQRLDDALALLAGVALGFAFQFRYQTGFVALGLLLWASLVARWPARALGRTALGLTAIVVLGLIVDRWGYGAWTLTPYNYLEENLFHGRAASFGVRPPWGYFGLLWHDLPKPFGGLLALLPLIAFARRPRHLLTFGFVPFLLVHAAVGHKETRFLFPFLAVAPALSLMAIPELWARRSHRVSAFAGVLFAVWLFWLTVWRPPLLGGWLAEAVGASAPDAELVYAGPPPLETPLVPRSLLGARTLASTSEAAVLARLSLEPETKFLFLRDAGPLEVLLARRCRRVGQDPRRLALLPESVRSRRVLLRALGIRRPLDLLSCGGRP